MRKTKVLATLVVASMITAIVPKVVDATVTQKLCRPLLSGSYIVCGDVGSCVDPLVDIFNKLGISINDKTDCPIVIIPGTCIPEEITSKPSTDAETEAPNEPETTGVPETTTVPETTVVPETTTVPETTVPEIGTTQKPTERPEEPTTSEVGTTQEPTTIPEETTAAVSNSYAEQVVNLVNKERAKAGLKALVIDKNIEAAALIRAKETEISFSHTRPNGSSFSTVLRENGISFRGAGENIAWGQKSPEQVMKGWMNSPGHRANILNPRYTKIGVGYYKSSTGRQYWTQLFTY